MNNFKPGGFKKGGGAFGPRTKFSDRKKEGGFGNRDNSRDNRDSRGGEQKEMFTATCSTCGKKCEVPFRPSGDKPVYCRDCFANTDNRGGQSDKGYSDKRKDFSRERRREDAPRREFSTPKTDPAIEDVKRQLAIVESKLNRILELINPPQPKVVKAKVIAPEVVDEEVPKKIRKPKTVKATKAVKAKAPAKKKVSKK